MPEEPLPPLCPPSTSRRPESAAGICVEPRRGLSTPSVLLVTLPSPEPSGCSVPAGHAPRGQPAFASAAPFPAILLPESGPARPPSTAASPGCALPGHRRHSAAPGLLCGPAPSTPLCRSQPHWKAARDRTQSHSGPRCTWSGPRGGRTKLNRGMTVSQIYSWGRL